jgi:hypothetical protein
MADETPFHKICNCEAIDLLRYHHFLEFFLETKAEWKVQHLTQSLNHPKIINLESNPQKPVTPCHSTQTPGLPKLSSQTNQNKSRISWTDNNMPLFRGRLLRLKHQWRSS